MPKPVPPTTPITHNPPQGTGGSLQEPPRESQLRQNCCCGCRAWPFVVLHTCFIWLVRLWDTPKGSTGHFRMGRLHTHDLCSQSILLGGLVQHSQDWRALMLQWGPEDTARRPEKILTRLQGFSGSLLVQRTIGNYVLPVLLNRKVPSRNRVPVLPLPSGWGGWGLVGWVGRLGWGGGGGWVGEVS
jgi:hypothetical protein